MPREVEEIVASALAAANQLRWRRFTYQRGDRPGVGLDDTYTLDPGTELVGPVVADMVDDPVLSGIVYYDPDTGEPTSYDLSSLVGLLGKAVAELSEEVAELRRKVEKKPDVKYPWEPGWSPFGQQK